MSQAKEVVIQDDVKQPEKEVNLEINENGQVVKPEAEKKQEPKYVTSDELSLSLEQAIKKATAPLYYELRNSKKSPEAQTPAAQQTPTAQADEWDQKLQKDWKSTVKELARQEAGELRKQEREQERFEQEKQRNLNLLESNKKSVLERHPELNDEQSDKATFYRQVIQEHPEYLNNTFGPVLAMHEMEHKMRESGVLDSATKKTVEKEVLRQTRAGAGSLPKGAPSGRKTVTLTREDKELCDANGWDYGKYISNKHKLNGNGGVEA